MSDSDFEGYVDSEDEEYATSDRENKRRENIEVEVVNDMEWNARMVLDGDSEMDISEDMGEGERDRGEGICGEGDGSGVGSGEGAGGEREIEEPTDEIVEGSDNEDNGSTRNISVPTFRESSGVIPDMTGKEPVDYFELYFTDELKRHIVQETNRYGDQCVESHEQHLLTHPRGYDFIKRRFTITDILRFLGLNFVMRVVSLPKIPQYWSKRWPFHSSNFSRILSRVRFQLVSSCG